MSTRGVTEHLASALGEPFPIDNRGGAGGNIAGAMAAKARPDGYTLLFAATGPAATNKLMYKDLTFDPQRDFTPVILVANRRSSSSHGRMRRSARSRS